MHGLEGEALDEFLSHSGFDPKELLADFDGSVRSFEASAGRRLFEAAKIAVSSAGRKTNVLNLEASRKRSVFSAVKERMATTGEMTIAARNQKIDSEEDLDRFLEACLGLGIIDENGDLKD
jgi:hypothetical protein